MDVDFFLKFDRKGREKSKQMIYMYKASTGTERTS